MIPLDLVIDDLACIRDGQCASLTQKQLASEALEWLILLMQKARLGEADTFKRVYSRDEPRLGDAR
jgi:hypothetical protein